MSSWDDYSFLGISVCEERVARKSAGKKTVVKKASVVVKKIVGVFRLPSCCAPSDEFGDEDYHSHPSYHNGVVRQNYTDPPAKKPQQKVIISSPNFSTQKSMLKQGQWKLGFEAVNKWKNPVMAWTSTGDSYSNAGDSGLYFESKAAAIDFAKNHGWPYKIREPTVPREPKYNMQKVKTYSDNPRWKAPLLSERGSLNPNV